ncbi:MAG: chemotaxis protein, partial [Erythrobacter sp.]
ALGDEASTVIGRIEDGSEASGAAKESVARIESTISSVGELVEEVDKQNDVIARSTGTISGHVDAVQRVLKIFDGAARTNETQLEGANERMAELELTANEMFDSLVHSGLSPHDSMMVDRAQVTARKISAITSEALSVNELTETMLFDHGYQPIPNSNPKRFRTTLTDWADKKWRPILTEMAEVDPSIFAVVCNDLNGFLPTHTEKYSRIPTGELAHDTEFCRNGRIVKELSSRGVYQAGANYKMTVYRQEGDGRHHVVHRNVYVPLVFAGRNWGNLILGYVV